MSRKTMRVATVFMGATACTIAGATAANAQDAVALRAPFERVTGSIREVTQCGQKGEDSHWLHVVSQQSPVSYCYGYKGAGLPLSEIGISFECGGNNYGWLTGWTSGQTRTWGYHYGPGGGYRYSANSSLQDVTISKWAGELKCPTY